MHIDNIKKQAKSGWNVFQTWLDHNIRTLKETYIMIPHFFNLLSERFTKGNFILRGLTLEILFFVALATGCQN